MKRKRGEESHLLEPNDHSRMNTRANATPPAVRSCASMPVVRHAGSPNIGSFGSDIASLILSHLSEREIVMLLTAAKEVGSFTHVVSEYAEQPCVRCNDNLSALSNDLSACSCTCGKPAPLASLQTLNMSPLRLSVRAFMAHRIMRVPFGHTLSPFAVDFVSKRRCRECKQALAFCYGSLLCQSCIQKPRLILTTYTRTDLQRLYAPYLSRSQAREVVNKLVLPGEKKVYWAVMATRLQSTYENAQQLAKAVLGSVKIDRTALFISFLRRPTHVHRYLFEQYLPTLLTTHVDSSSIIKTLKDGTLDLSLFQQTPQPELIMALPMLQFPKTSLYLLSHHATLQSLNEDPLASSAWPIAKAYNNLSQLMLRSGFAYNGGSTTHHVAQVCAWVLMMENVNTRFMMCMALGMPTPSTINETIMNIQSSVSKLTQLLLQYVSGEVTLETVSQFRITVEGGFFDHDRLSKVWDWTLKITRNYWTPPRVAPVQCLHRLLWALQLASLWHDECPFLLHTKKILKRDAQQAGTPLKKGFLHFNPITKVSSVSLQKTP